VDGCERKHEAHGLCSRHYQRLKKTGSLEQPLATGSDEERFWIKVDRSRGPDTCWLWLAGISGNTGYGNIWWLGRTQSAHRVAYTLVKGSIPPELTIDHLCRVRHCVNPDHMEIVTQAENNRRILVTRLTRHKRSEAGRKGGYARAEALRLKQAK
jgi:hypothetical protein